MKISYFDLNTDFCENYSINPQKGGGGRIFASAAKQYMSDFHIFSKKDSFKDFTDKDISSNCHIVSQEQLDKIMDGQKVCKIIPECEDSDIFMHHNNRYSLNLEGCKTQNELVWPVGYAETINPKIKNLAFFDFEHQEPVLKHNNHKIYHVVIGPKVESFKEYKKENFIFQCTRHNHLFQSIEIAKLCLKYKIPIIFAGNIEQNYKLLDYIDGKTTIYLGEISQDTKIELNKVASYHVQFQIYPTLITLSAKEALSYGTPILATNYGNWKWFIKNSKNGYLINNEQDFVNAWSKRNEFNQKDCYDSILFTSEEKMIESFNRVFNDIVFPHLNHSE